MDPRVNYRTTDRIPVARHLNDEEYTDFLDGYAFFSGSKDAAERAKYCANQIRSVVRENHSLIVTYNDGVQFIIQTDDVTENGAG